jgi:ABC-2 type transport system permease protein
VSFASAAVLLVRASAKNRLRRLLKQPRYLIFTLVGLLYLVSIGGKRWSSGAAPDGMPGFDASQPSPGLALAVGLGVFAYLGAVWLFGGDTASLQFTEAEVQFFFPAPVGRRALLHYKLVRKLLGALATGPLLAIILRRGGHPLYASVGFFLVFAALSLHSAAASMTRASLAEHGISGLKRRAPTLVVLAAVLGGLTWSVSRVHGALPGLPADHFEAWLAAAQAWAEANAAALAWALWPVTAMMRVTAATTSTQLFAALPAALLVVAVHYVWAASISVAFEESAAEAAEKRGRELERARAGQIGVVRRTKPLFRLGATGAPWVAILWKNLVAATRVSLRRVVILAIAFLAVPLMMLVTLRGTRAELFGLFAGVAVGLAIVTAIIGPHAVRNDLRQDVEVMDILRSYPIAGRQVVLGEIAAPLATLAAIEWLLLALAAALAVASPGPTRLVVLGAIACVALLPAVTACGLVLRNLLVLVLPSWATSAAQETRGLEMTGQRMLLMFGTLLVLVVALFPAWLTGGVLLFALGGSGFAAIPVAAFSAATVAAFESYLAIAFLGRAYDRFDVSQP